MHAIQRLLCLLCLICSSPFLPLAWAKVWNVSVPETDPQRPGCLRVFTWKVTYVFSDFSTWNGKCASEFQGSTILPVEWVSAFSNIVKTQTAITGDTEFFVQSDNGVYCGVAALSIVRPQSFTGRITWHTMGNNFRCNSQLSVRVTHLVCARLWCPPQTTTSTTSSTVVPTTALTTDAVVELKVGALGIPLGSELLLYRIAILVLFLLLLLFIILLARTCVRLRRANMKHSMQDGRSHVSIRRVTEAVVDPYSSMAGIGETSSLGGPEFYGSIARRKELSRERKAWLRDHACGGSHIGVPPAEDMNGLLPPHGAIHRTSISSLTTGGGHGHNGSLSRVPGIRGPPGTYPIRPPGCQLSRQNTGDSLHYRTAGAPPSLTPSPGVNGTHSTPLSRDEMEGHMV